MRSKITSGIILGSLAMVCSLGCAVQKQWVPVGGSRSDGTVKLSYEYGMFENPQLSAQQGLEAAAARCKAWGYSNADAFGGVQRNCTSRDQYGSCTYWIVSAEYQCTGGTRPPPIQ